MKRAVLLTGHYWASRRQAGYHSIARSLLDKGWEVLFFTAPLSWFSILRRDYRTQYPVYSERCRLIKKEERLWSYVWFTPWHPVNLRLRFLNRLSHGLFSKYGEFSLGESESFIKESNLFIFESSPALFLVKRMKQLCPHARMVYRVSDDLRLLGSHLALIELEQRLAPSFDLVSVPCQHIYNLFGELPNARLQYHGIRQDLFDGDYENPYPVTDKPNLIFVGNSFFDHDFLERASYLFPKWNFHIIGPISKLPRRDNVIGYGEIPFKKTIPYLKYARVGLQIRAYFPGAESLTDSLKVIQYSYCRLPVIAPEFLRSNMSHIFCYKPGDQNSIKDALSQAINFDRNKISVDHINSWDDLTDQLTGEKIKLKNV